jgi:hypothetical protein
MKRYIKAAVKPLSDEDLETKRGITRDSETSSELLWQLYNENVNSEDWETQYFVCLELAQNPNTPREILMQMASNWRTDQRILHSIGSNPNADIEILNVLSTYDLSIKASVAENPNATPELLWKLAKSKLTIPSFKDDYSIMLCRIAWNPNVTADLLEFLSHSEDHYVRAAVARNPNTPIDTLKRLMEYDEDYHVQSSLGKNPNIQLLLGR